MYAARTRYVLFYLRTDVFVGLLKNTNVSDERRGNVTTFNRHNYDNPRALVYLKTSAPGPFLHSRPRDYFGIKYHTPSNTIYVRMWCVRINNGDPSQCCFTKTDTFTRTLCVPDAYYSVCPCGQNMYRVSYDWMCYGINKSRFKKIIGSYNRWIFHRVRRILFPGIMHLGFDSFRFVSVHCEQYKRNDRIRLSDADGR